MRVNYSTQRRAHGVGEEEKGGRDTCWERGFCPDYKTCLPCQGDEF